MYTNCFPFFALESTAAVQRQPASGSSADQAVLLAEEIYIECTKAGNTKLTGAKLNVGNGWVAGGCWDYYYYSDEMDHSRKSPA
jgi:hypothetical protein